MITRVDVTDDRETVTVARRRIATEDVVAVVGLALLAAGVGLIFTFAASLVVVGIALLAYAIAVSLSAPSAETQ